MNDKIGDITGLVFHIIRGSFVDGYGIRTTVFLKGCPLRCLWCCNPEGQDVQPEIKLVTEKCNGCGKCISICSTGAIRLSNREAKVEINRQLCNHCGHCIDVCYTGALEYFGKRMTVEELFNLVKKDEQYYRTSEGGVTIGGGEPTTQPLFTLALLQKCRENYIHTAVDTCGYTLSDDGFRILKEADLLLFDVKGIDPQEHRRNTGVPNGIILSNLRELSAMGKAMIIRVPIVPEYTDSIEGLKSTADFLSRLKSVERVDLMFYHEYGKIKYQELGREYPLHVSPLTSESLNSIKAVFEKHGMKVQLGG